MSCQQHIGMNRNCWPNHQQYPRYTMDSSEGHEEGVPTAHGSAAIFHPHLHQHHHPDSSPNRDDETAHLPVGADSVNAHDAQISPFGSQHLPATDSRYSSLASSPFNVDDLANDPAVTRQQHVHQHDDDVDDDDGTEDQKPAAARVKQEGGESTHHTRHSISSDPFGGERIFHSTSDEDNRQGRVAAYDESMNMPVLNHPSPSYPAPHHHTNTFHQPHHPSPSASYHDYPAGSMVSYPPPSSARHPATGPSPSPHNMMRLHQPPHVFRFGHGTAPFTHQTLNLDAAAAPNNPLTSVTREKKPKKKAATSTRKSSRGAKKPPPPVVTAPATAAAVAAAASRSGERTSQLRRSPTHQEEKDAKTPRAKAALLTWYQRLSDLIEYKEQHGDCNVPQKYPPNTALGIWVNKQRMEKKFLDEGKKSSMTPYKLEALAAAGFTWARRKGQPSWDKRYQELLVYRDRHGNCEVPTKYSVNPALGRWVSTQRSQYKHYKRLQDQDDDEGRRHVTEGPLSVVAMSSNNKTQMNQYRVDKLEEIGFRWNMMDQQHQQQHSSNGEEEEDDEDEEEGISGGGGRSSGGRSSGGSFEPDHHDDSIRSRCV